MVVALTQHINFKESQKAFLRKKHFVEAIWSKVNNLISKFSLVDSYVRFIGLNKSNNS